MTMTDAKADNDAVDLFAAEMKEKLAAARSKGRGGWQDKGACSQQVLSDMLRKHVEKGDPRDVANFCMFLHQRGEGIAPAAMDGGHVQALLQAITDAAHKAGIIHADARVDGPTAIMLCEDLALAAMAKGEE